MNECNVDGCIDKVASRGLCGKHRIRLHRHGDPNVTKINVDGLHNGYLYNTHHDITQRCLNKNNKSYHNYGGRGIKVYPKWLGKNGFTIFRQYILNNLGNRPTGYTLDRIDNNKGYEPGNLRWATRKEQILNRRNNRNNTTGIKGVYWEKTTSKWRASICVDNKNIGLGRFTDIEEAASARLMAESIYDY